MVVVMQQSKRAAGYLSEAIRYFLRIRWSWWSVLAALALAALYAIMVGLVVARLRAPVLAWPVLALLFWYAFSRWNLLRFAGFVGILPAAVLIFEVFQFYSAASPEAFRYISLDRSHYTPELRVSQIEILGGQG